jgi:hypothetical protein
MAIMDESQLESDDEMGDDDDKEISDTGIIPNHFRKKFDI